MSCTDRTITIPEEIANNEANTEQAIEKLYAFVNAINDDGTNATETQELINDNKEIISLPVTANYTIKKTDYSLAVDTSTTAITLTFPLDIDINDGKSFEIIDDSINCNSHNITINMPGTAKIYGKGIDPAGVSTLVLSSAGDVIEIRKRSTNKYRVVRKV